MKSFQITVRTETGCTKYNALAVSSSKAAMDAYALFADIPCGVTVTSSR